MEFTPQMQGCFNLEQSINVTHCINRMNDKNYMSISIDADKKFDKIQHLNPLIETFNKLCVKEIYLNIIKVYMRNPQLTSDSMVKS